jgi:HK97 gp10 family phage protein
MMSFRNLDAFLAHLATVPAAVKVAQKHGLEEGARLIEREAKDLIGQEYPGWEPLAESTVEEKRRLGYTGRDSATDPLYRTGELRASIQHRVDETSAQIGTDDPIAEYQEHGTTKMPPRPFMAPAAHRKGEAAANAIGKAVGHAVAGLRLPEPTNLNE